MPTYEHNVIKILSVILLFNVAFTLSSGNCEHNTVRLVDGKTDTLSQKMDGRLEICINNAWGSICNNSFRVVDAQVACRQAIGYDMMGRFP